MFDYWFKYRSARDALDRSEDALLKKTEHARELADKLKTAHADLEFANTEKNRQAEEISRLKREIKAANETIREQTGADLLVNALRELGVVPKPEKAPDAFDEQRRLLAQMQAAAPAQSMSEARAGQHQGSGLASLLGGAIR